MTRAICTVFLMTILALCGGATDAAGAEKPRKSPAKRERAQPSNPSMRTQQRTGDAMADKMGRSTAPAKAEGKAGSPDLRSELEEVERRLNAEFERFTNALARLRASEQAAVKSGKSKSVASARKAIARETSAHERNKAALVGQRDALRRKLGLEPAPADGAGERPRDAKGRTPARPVE